MSSWDAFVEHVIVHYRWVFVLFLLPVSLAYDIFYYARSSIVFRLSSAPAKHQEKVRNVQRQVREWNESDQDRPMCTARPGWQTISPQQMSYKNRMHKVEVNLVDVLKVDTEDRFVRCEPLVTMGQLTHLLDRLGWTIPIVPELDDLTVGGLVMGTGIETSSHIYGLFQHICLSYEIVMSDGSVVTCSEDDNPDLFHAIPWSYGTLGFLVSVDIKIIPSKRFVKMNYLPVYSMDAAVETLSLELNKESADSPDLVECLVFSKDRAVIMTGKMVDSCGQLEQLNEIGSWHKPWFFKHVESFLEKGEAVEYIPLRDYYHRHSRSIFWEIQDIIPFGNNIVFRYLLGWLVPPKVSLLKLTQGKTLKKLYEEHHLIQDMLVPFSELKRSLEFFDEETRIYPIWLCPFKLPSNPGMLRTATGEKEMFIDIGVYGTPTRPSFHHVETTRKIEKFVRDVNGFQMLYADSYLSKDEFLQMFDTTLYDEMRTKHNCKKAFPHVYDKISKKARV